MQGAWEVREYGLASPIEVGNVFVGRVYRWMGIGLGVTAAVALLVSSSPALVRAIFGTPALPLVLIVAQLGLVFAIGSAVNRASAALATGLFLAYAALLGVTMSVILLVYTAASIASTFAVTGGMFGCMSLYGWATKRDLTSMGSFLVMGLIGLILASIVNIFLASEALHWLLTYAGVAIFLGLTAWDTQKIKRIGMRVDAESEQGKSLAIHGALALYLDFVNLFLFLLRILGRRR